MLFLELVVLLGIIAAGHVWGDGRMPIQDSQLINITLNPESNIDSQTNLSIIVQHKYGNATEFELSDLFSVSKDFEKMFSYSPRNNIIRINLRKFVGKQYMPGYFVVNCVFETEVDEDTHWEVLWLSSLTEGDDIPMTTFFVKANIPTKMEIECQELYTSDCSKLSEGDDVIITCNIQTGMPFLKAYLNLPSESNPVYLSNSMRQVKARIKLTRESRNSQLVCGAGDTSISDTRPFEFMLNPETSSEKMDSVIVTIVVAISSVVTILSIFVGTYLVLVKPAKERSQEKVEHHVEVATETDKRNMQNLASASESRRASHVTVESNSLRASHKG